MTERSRLQPPKGAVRRKARVGRGQASGLGKTAGRGGKGQKARTGNMHFEGFEGGQTPLQRRMPKRGFTNIHRVEYQIVNLGDLAFLDPQVVVGPDLLAAAGLIKNPAAKIKILGDGELCDLEGKAVALTIHAHKFTASALEKIAGAGGRAEVISPASSAQG